MRVVLSAALDGTKCFNSEGIIEIREGVVTSAEVALALDAASAVLLQPGSHIQHVLGDFSVDGGTWTRDPVGAQGRELRARVHLITVPVEAVQQLETVLKPAGVDIGRLVLEPFSLATFAEVAVSTEEKQRGVVMIELIGLGQPAAVMVVLVNGRVEHSAVLFSTRGSRERERRTDLVSLFRSVRREIWKSGCAPLLSGVKIISDGAIRDSAEELSDKILELPASFRSAREAFRLQQTAGASAGSTALRLLWDGTALTPREGET